MNILKNKKTTALLAGLIAVSLSPYALAQDEAPVFDEPAATTFEQPSFEGRGRRMKNREEGEMPRKKRQKFMNQEGGEEGDFPRRMNQEPMNPEWDGEREGNFRQGMKQKFQDGQKGKEFIKKVVSELPPDVQSQCNACHRAIDEHIKSKIEERKEGKQGDRAEKLGQFLESQGIDMESLSDEELAKIKDVIKRRQEQKKDGFAKGKGKPEFAREREFAPEAAPFAEDANNEIQPASAREEGKKGLFKRFF